MQKSAVEPQTGQIITGSCPLCESTRVRVYPFRYAFHDRFIRGVGCASCALVFLHPMPSDDEIAGMYSEEYFTECTDTCGAHGPRAYVELIEESAGGRRKGALRLDRALVGHHGFRGTFCEVGCGPGHFLDEMRRLGWVVQGLEISEFAARQAREKLGLNVTTGAIGDKMLPAGEFDAVFLGDVLEHLPRPRKALAEVHESLRPGGLIAVAIPSTLNLVSGRLGMWLFRQTGRVKTLRIPPYHLVEYTPRTLKRMLERCGFELLWLRQSAVPIRRMGLRGSAFENTGKVTLQFLAHTTSLVFNRGGDRLLAVGRKATS